MATIRRRDINQAVGGLHFDENIVGVEWRFSPSLGIVARDLDRLGLAIKDLREPLKRAIRRVMIPSIRKNFAQGGRPRWEPLAPYTLEQKGKAGVSSGDKPLYRTGALERGATKMSIWTFTDTSASIRSLPNEIWYGAIHQAGYGGFGAHVQAARKILGPRASSSEILKKAFDILDSTGAKSTHRKVHIPARPFVMFQEGDTDDIVDIFAEWLEETAVHQGRFHRL